MGNMKLVEYKINRYGNTPFNGVLLGESHQWIATKNNETDYQLDGFCFINKHFVKDLKEIDRESMKSKIIQLKYVDYDKDVEIVSKLNIEDHQGFFKSIKSLGQLIDIGLHWNDAIFVGTISDVYQKSFVINSIDAETNDDGKMKMKFSSVRYIKIYTDYLNSLSLYIKWKEKLERSHRDGAEMIRLSDN